RGAPTRARFTFDPPLEDPGLTFHCWNKAELAAWTPPPVGARQLEHGGSDLAGP
ncbi:MAG: hypothetical protein HGA94_00240, partial [Candidatus Aminicenantes bacterium]|nr:hypothetical protein [Candidatus Aminicenantes bacterium]